MAVGQTLSLLHAIKGSAERDYGIVRSEGFQVLYLCDPLNIPVVGGK